MLFTKLQSRFLAAISDRLTVGKTKSKNKLYVEQMGDQCGTEWKHRHTCMPVSCNAFHNPGRASVIESLVTIMQV